VQRRPDPSFRPNAAQQEELDAIASLAQRLTRYRAMRDDQPGA
jgi:hypothetical protein